MYRAASQKVSELEEAKGKGKRDQFEERQRDALASQKIESNKGHGFERQSRDHVQSLTA